jgi:hypothetical protein
MIKKIIPQVATKLSAQRIKPIISAIVTPKPIIEDTISQTQRNIENSQTNNNNNDQTIIANSIELSSQTSTTDTSEYTSQPGITITYENTNNNVNTVNPINNDIDHYLTANNIEVSTLTSTTDTYIDNSQSGITITHENTTHNGTPVNPINNDTINHLRTKKYLISHFFPKINKNQTVTETISTIIPPNNLPLIQLSAEEYQPIQTQNTLEVEDDIRHSHDIDNGSNKVIRKRKYYIQQHILKKPIANDYWGSSMDSYDINCFRVYYQNINGLTSGESLNQWADIVNTMKDHKCDIFGYSETNTNWQYQNTKTRINHIINKQFPNSSTTLSDNRFNPNDSSRYLPGGAIQSCTGYWTSRLISTIHDPRKMGRWTGQKFRLKANRTLTIITAYRSCKKNNTNNKSTSISTYRQQSVMLTEDGYETPDPRKVFIQDIITLIKDHDQSTSNYTILMLDANENMNDSEGGLSSLVQETNLIDVFSEIGNEDCNIPTYTRGSRKIDYILASAELLPHIKYMGCLPFYMYNNSDHRGLFIDISVNMIGNKVELKQPVRRLIGTNSSRMDKFNYKKYRDDQFHHQNIYNKVRNLSHLSSISTLEEMENMINNLDANITKIMMSAEKKCCNARHDSNWSVALHVCSLMCKYWVKTFKGAKNNINVSRQIAPLYSKLPPNKKDEILLLIHNKTNRELQSIAKQQLRRHILYKKELLSKHKKLRQQDLLQFQADHLSKGQGKEASIIRKIANCEMRKADWDKVRNTFNPRVRSGLCTLEVPLKDAQGNDTNDPDEAVTWKRVSDPKEIEDCLLARNIKHFGQAEGSLFTRPDITQLFNYEGTSTYVETLLEGQCNIDNIPNLNNQAKTLFNLLNNKKKLNKFESSITFNEFKATFAKWNEKTTTSPSGRHLGHYKCLLRPDNCDTLYDEQYDDPKDRIMKVYFDIVDIAITLGISLKRWQHSTTTMIEKIPGCPKINKLRVIHLYEADYNIILKILWARKLVWHAHDNDKLHEGQAGSRPGRNAIDVIIQKEMKYLFSRLTKTNIATMDNDAKSCYDRIICNLAMIISQYFGISKNTASVQAKTLKYMQYRLRTALGDSVTTYQHSAETPIHGTGQGSCASPAIWLIISSILMDCLSDLGGGMTMIDVCSNNALQQWIDGFVDDTSLFTNLLNKTSTDNVPLLCKYLQNDMIIWKNLLEASGGKLELSKCFYYILSWKFDQEGNGIPMSISDQRARNVTQISITDHTDSHIPITQKEVNKSHKTLGVYKAIDGNELEQITQLKIKSEAFGRKVQKASLSRKQANMAYKMVYIPSLKYGLPACSLTLDNINYIQNSALDKFLPAMGYEHGTPRALIHGPQEMGGVEIPHLFTEMLGMKIEAIISHIRANTVLGKSICINLNYLQLRAGIEKPILTCRDDLGYICPNWILHIRDYLIDINGSLDIKNVWIPIKQRQHDVILMQEFRLLGLSNSELRLVNNWRIFFQVSTLVELCNPEGNRIQPCFLTKPSGRIVTKENPTNLRWPIQREPGKRGFALWLKCINTCFQPYNKGRINHQFGRWMSSEEIQKVNEWKFYYQPSTDFLFSKQDGGYLCGQAKSKGKNSARYIAHEPGFMRSILPSDCIPADVRIDKNGIYTATFNNTNPPANLKMKTKVKWTNHFTDNTIIKDVQKTKDLLTSTTSPIIIVSDGGVHNYEGTFGVVISDGIYPIVHNNGKLYSVDFFESSFRSELYAMLAGLLTLEALCNEFGAICNTQRHIRLFSDNKRVVQRISNRRRNKRTINQHRDSDVDLELQLLHEILKWEEKQMIITISFVRSHQELIKIKKELTHIETLNIIADSLAKKARNYCRLSQYHSLPQNPVDFKINNIAINSKYALRSKKAFHSIAFRKYLQDKYSWSHTTIESIWWKAYHNSITNLNSAERAIIFKFIHDRLPTKSRSNKYYSYRSKHCDSCQSDTEDEDHILRCHSANRLQSRKAWYDAISDYLSAAHTPPFVKTSIVSNLHYWLESSEITHTMLDDDNDNGRTSKAIYQQNNIGWNHFIRGRLSIEWGNIVQSHLETNQIKNMSAEKWGSDLLFINWKHILKIWRERCEEVHGKTPEQIEKSSKARLLEEIRHIQSSNTNLAHSEHNWILEHIDTLSEYNSKTLASWLYGAKIISKINKTKMQYHYKQNTARHLYSNSTNIIPLDKKIRKEDLDPGDNLPHCDR